MSSSLHYCDIGNHLLNSTDLTHYATDWSNCTYGDCIDDNKYRIPYVGCCLDGSGNLSSTVSKLRQCWIQTGDVELSPCVDDGKQFWDCFRTAPDYSRYRLEWAPWQEKWCKRKSQNVTFRVGWRVRFANSVQRVKFIEMHSKNRTCPTEIDGPNEVVVFTVIAILALFSICFFTGVCCNIKGAKRFCLTLCGKRKRRLQRTRVRAEGSSVNDGLSYDEIMFANDLNLATIIGDGSSVNGYSPSSISDTSSGGGGRSATLQNIAISTISLPPTYDEIISSDNRNLAVLRNTTITRTTTTEVNPIIPPPSYDMLFKAGARQAELPGNERPPSYSNVSHSFSRPAVLTGNELNDTI